MGSPIGRLYELYMMKEYKERLDNTGIKYSKAREYLGIGRSHFSRCLNEKALLSEELEIKLEYFLQQYERIKL